MPPTSPVPTSAHHPSDVQKQKKSSLASLSLECWAQRLRKITWQSARLSAWQAARSAEGQFLPTPPADQLPRADLTGRWRDWRLTGHVYTTERKQCKPDPARVIAGCHRLLPSFLRKIQAEPRRTVYRSGSASAAREEELREQGVLPARSFLSDRNKVLIEVGTWGPG